MKIAIDGTSWFNGRGYGRYTRELLPQIVAAGPEHEFVVLVEEMNAGKLDLGGAEIHAVPCGVAPAEAAAADGYRSPADMLRFTRGVRRVRPDVLFFPTVYSFFPLPPGTRGVVTVHDTITERFPHLTLPSARARMFWRLKVRLALLQCRAVLTVSDYAAREIQQHLGVAADRLHVSSEAPAQVYTHEVSEDEVVAAAAHVGLPERARWITYVGGFNPHKRVDLLVRAHARLAASSDDPPHLLLVGSIGGDVFHGCQAQIAALPAELGTAELVHWTGFVPDERLRALHAGAIACVLPSESEGFGLPAVEAAACGAAVVATTESPLPELLEGGGIFISPGDVDALAGALRRLDTEDGFRAECGRNGRARARALSWPDAGRRALAAIESAAR